MSEVVGVCHQCYLTRETKVRGGEVPPVLHYFSTAPSVDIANLYL